MFVHEQQVITEQIRQYCQVHSIPDPVEVQWNPIPFSGRWGISTSFFHLAAKEARAGAKVNVALRAQEIAIGIAEYLGQPQGFEKVEAVKGYLNLYFSPSEFTRRVVDTVLEQGQDFGRGESRGERVLVEFSNPNTHKAFHVGHLRSAILGDVVCRILEFAGFEVIRANYIGDIGLHVIKWLWNYLRTHQGEQPPGEDKTRWMGDLYAEATRLLEEEPTLEEEVRQLFTAWDRKETQVVSAWQQTRQWSLDGFSQIYRTLDIKFDRYYFNSEVEESGKTVVDELIQRGLAIDERPQGPVLVRLDDLLGLKEEKYRVLVILRSDNTALYATEDLSLAKLKYSEYSPDRSVYVVDVRQSLYFQQVFKTLELMGYPWAKSCHHLAYELVSLPGNVVIASREGAVVLLEDLMREAIQRAYAIVQEKNPTLLQDQKQRVAEAVGLGALKYPMLARDNNKVVTFDWESALDFEGQAAPYIQYAHVRASSILHRYHEEAASASNVEFVNLPEPITPQYPLDASEVRLTDLITRLPSEVQRAAIEYKPLHLTNLAYELARAFNDFYNACPVLKTEPPVQAARLRLVAAARQTIANTLNLLGITAPAVM